MLAKLKTKIMRQAHTLASFGGLNLTENSRPGELCLSENITSDDYPALKSIRPKKCVFETDRIINGITCHNGVVCTSYHADNSNIVLTYCGEDYEFGNISSSDDFSLDRKMTSLSDCILIIPDNVIFFTNTRTFSKICVLQTYSSATIRAKQKKEAPDSNLFSTQTLISAAKLEHNCISATKTQYYSGSNYDFYHIAFDASLKAGDVVTVKGTVLSHSDVDTKKFLEYQKRISAGLTLKIKDITTKKHSTPTGEITEVTELIFDDNTVDTSGFFNLHFHSLTVERGVPSLENICSHANRIWGTAGNEIFTSKLSDASEWNDFTQDSYGTLPYACFNTTVETEGDFTAIATFDQYIYAFKENAVHKIYGNEPMEYSILKTASIGVAPGCADSVASCQDALFYASSDGIYIYRDGNPRLISDTLCNKLSVLSAKATNLKYYLLTEDGAHKHIYTYDYAKGIWHMQTANADSRFLCEHGNRIFEAGGGKIFVLEDENPDSETLWKFRIRLNDDMFGKKNHGQLLIKYAIEKNAFFTVCPIYDDETKGEPCAIFHDEENHGECLIFLKHKRCRLITLEFRGSGMFTLRSIKTVFYRGSEI